MRERNYTLKQIAELLKNDHSTVVFHLRRYENLMDVDKAFQRKEREFDFDNYVQVNGLEWALRELTSPKVLASYLVN